MEWFYVGLARVANLFIMLAVFLDLTLYKVQRHHGHLFIHVVTLRRLYKSNNPISVPDDASMMDEISKS